MIFSRVPWHLTIQEFGQLTGYEFHSIKETVSWLTINNYVIIIVNLLCLDDTVPLNKVEIASVSGGGEEFQYNPGINSSLVWPGIAHTTWNYTTPVKGYIATNFGGNIDKQDGIFRFWQKVFTVILYYTEFIPYDGVADNVTVSVSVAVTVPYTLLTILGIVFAVVCLSFNIIFRNTK